MEEVCFQLCLLYPGCSWADILACLVIWVNAGYSYCGLVFAKQSGYLALITQYSKHLEAGLFAFLLFLSLFLFPYPFRLKAPSLVSPFVLFAIHEEQMQSYMFLSTFLISHLWLSEVKFKSKLSLTCKMLSTQVNYVSLYISVI